MTDSELFWLRAVPHPSTPSATKFSETFMRLHGNGINAIMMMPNPPKFLRSHLSPEGKVLITSWKHPGREWGLKLSGLDLPEGKQKAALWHAAEIVQDEGDARFEFKETGSQEELVVKQAVVVDDKEEPWSGWMICDWKYDHPQLFWTTTKGGAAEKLPPFCERVLLVKQRLTEADIETQMKN